MEVVDILREGVGVALRIGAPLLILSMLVGIVVVAVLLVGGGWMLETLLDFSRYLFTLM